MSWRATAWLILLALAASVLWWLHHWIAAQAWAEWQGKDWRVAASGWSVLRFAWPVALLGLVPGALISWYVLDRAATAAARADHAEHQQRLEAERQWLQDEANRLEAQHLRLNQEQAAKEAEANRLIEAARATQTRAQQAIAAAQAQAAKAEKRAASANRRRQNATAAAGRMRRKLNTEAHHPGANMDAMSPGMGRSQDDS